ncbi:MAG: WG repeat-containing protein [Rhodoferax sp.]|nr:WG repeat-containing protein [Rhodoferax sp.]
MTTRHRVSKQSAGCAPAAFHYRGAPDFQSCNISNMTYTYRITISALAIALLGACAAPGPQYRNVGKYSEGLAPVQAQSGKWGFINQQQQWGIQPRFDEAKEFQDGKAAAKQGGKWGFINKQGNWQ